MFKKKIFFEKTAQHMQFIIVLCLHAHSDLHPPGLPCHFSLAP